ncbi:DUF4124 domain-containing protein [Legionella sp. D16C41]|uniref:DUF4124 domain-containing protein n=1 Tax=Legionella sp. D16C41 TaxID=3402688 RepID=UPI003AF6E13C
MVKIIIFALLIINNPLFAEIYKWTDGQGVVHFSDEPHPGAEKIVLPPTQVSSPLPTKIPTTNTTAHTTNDDDNSVANQESYKVSILAPKHETTIRNNQGYVSVVINTEPKLEKGELLQLIFDGQALGKPQVNNTFVLNNVNRGAHTIAVQIIGVNGDILSTSEPVTFYMQRARVGMVPYTSPTHRP